MKARRSEGRRWGEALQTAIAASRRMRARAGRLREETEAMLLSWQHSGFPVYAGEPVLAADADHLERLARCITRAPICLDAITPLDAERLVVCTPPDPQTGRQRTESEALD